MPVASERCFALARITRAAMLLTALMWTASSPAVPNNYGDLDGDGEATIADVVLLVNHLSGVDPLPAEVVPFADANRSGGAADAADLNWIVNALLGNNGLYAVNQFIQFETSRLMLAEGDDEGEIVVRFSGYVESGGTVTYAVSGGTATSGSDFVTLSGSTTVNIDRAVIPFSLQDDLALEGFETVEITLTGAPAGWDIALPRRHTVLIEDNDRVWNGSFTTGDNAYADYASFDIGLLRQGTALSAVVLGDTTMSIPNGDWPASVNFGGSDFILSATGIPMGASNLFGAPLTMSLTLDARDGSVTSSGQSQIEGNYTQTIAPSGSNYLSNTREGIFILIRAVDQIPLIPSDLLEPTS